MRLDGCQRALSTEPAELNRHVALRRNGHVDLCKALVRSKARVDAPREGCHSWHVPHGARMQKRRPRAAHLQHPTERASSGAKCSSVPCRAVPCLASVPVHGAWRVVRNMPRGACRLVIWRALRIHGACLFACVLACLIVCCSGWRDMLACCRTRAARCMRARRTTALGACRWADAAALHGSARQQGSVRERRPWAWGSLTTLTAD